MLRVARERVPGWGAADDRARGIILCVLVGDHAAVAAVPRIEAIAARRRAHRAGPSGGNDTSVVARPIGTCATSPAAGSEGYAGERRAADAHRAAERYRWQARCIDSPSLDFGDPRPRVAGAGDGDA